MHSPHCSTLHNTLHYAALHYTTLIAYTYTTHTTHTTPTHYTQLHYTTLPHIALHYLTLHSLHHHKCNCNYTTLITLHHSYNSTTLQLQLQLQHTTLHPAGCGWGDRPGDHCNHCNHTKKHNSNHLSVHQWIRSAIRDSQQPTSPIGFLFLKLPPPPTTGLYIHTFEGRLEVKLPTLLTDEKQRWEESAKRREE